MSGVKQSEYRLGYRADVEGLRAIAIVLVVAVHAGVPWLTGGFVGVDVFFVLSGFLITGLLLREKTENGKVQFLRFYLRRLRRLLPALYLMLAVVAVLAFLFLSPFEQLEQTSSAATAALWVSNFHFAFSQLGYFSPGAEANLFLHTWSLGVEEQFYLVWPALLVWLLARDGERGVRRLKIGMLVVGIISLALCVWLTHDAPQLAFYMMPMRAWQFCAGALVWLYFAAPSRKESRFNSQAMRSIGWLGLGLIILAGLWINAKMPYPGAWALLPTIGAAAVIAAGSRGTVPFGVSRLLSWKPLQWLGLVSYSWYLWHWPILLLGDAVTGSDAPGYRVAWVVLSLLLAIASYLLVEKPIRRQKFWLSRPRISIFGAVAVMILANALCLNWFVQASDRALSPQFKRYVLAHRDGPIIYAMGCDDWYHSARVRACLFGAKSAAKTAVLFGDSHAGQWSPTAAQVFLARGWRLLVLTKSSCPMVDEPFFLKRIGRMYTNCSTWREEAIKKIAAIKPDIVLMASDLAGFDRQQWLDGTASILNRLSPSVGKIYLFRDTPHLPFDGPNCLARHAGRAHWFGLAHSCTSQYSNAHARQVYDWMKTISANYANVGVIDMNNLICPNHSCSAERNGVIVFRDSQHLTRSFAKTLAPELANKLELAPKPAQPTK